MNPMRAFFLSFFAGLAVLLTGHSLVTTAFAEAPVQRLAA